MLTWGMGLTGLKIVDKFPQLREISLVALNLKCLNKACSFQLDCDALWPVCSAGLDVLAHLTKFTPVTTSKRDCHLLFGVTFKTSLPSLRSCMQMFSLVQDKR